MNDECQTDFEPTDPETGTSFSSLRSHLSKTTNRNVTRGSEGEMRKGKGEGVQDYKFQDPVPQKKTTPLPTILLLPPSLLPLLLLSLS